jgi:hypothetical protein
MSTTFLCDRRVSTASSLKSTDISISENVSLMPYKMLSVYEDSERTEQPFLVGVILYRFIA